MVHLTTCYCPPLSTRIVEKLPCERLALWLFVGGKKQSYYESHSWVGSRTIRIIASLDIQNVKLVISAPASETSRLVTTRFTFPGRRSKHPVKRSSFYPPTFGKTFFRLLWWLKRHLFLAISIFLQVLFSGFLFIYSFESYLYQLFIAAVGIV
jgi:hypothetical protein